jgi:hypothetical protein
VPQDRSVLDAQLARLLADALLAEELRAGLTPEPSTALLEPAAPNEQRSEHDHRNGDQGPMPRAG